MRVELSLFGSEKDAVLSVATLPSGSRTTPPSAVNEPANAQLEPSGECSNLKSTLLDGSSHVLRSRVSVTDVNPAATGVELML